uniref:Uncharacterized protein n=1 Tax=Mycena chlorophos TaxID=658473 RepID=A0ABQ0LPF9_MYCCL|nr:predicted protein [Mycena chlorophos]
MSVAMAPPSTLSGGPPRSRPGAKTSGRPGAQCLKTGVFGARSGVVAAQSMELRDRGQLEKVLECIARVLEARAAEAQLRKERRHNPPEGLPYRVQGFELDNGWVSGEECVEEPYCGYQSRRFSDVGVAQLVGGGSRNKQSTHYEKEGRDLNELGVWDVAYVVGEGGIDRLPRDVGKLDECRVGNQSICVTTKGIVCLAVARDKGADVGMEPKRVL